MKKNHSTLVRAAAITAAATGALLCGLGVYLSFTITGGKRQTLEEALQWQKDHYDISWFDTIETSEYTIRSFDGYELHVQLCKCPQESSKYMILTHGYTDNRFGTLKYMKLYMDRGFNCVIYDLRGHGVNKKEACTYSIREAKDLNVLIADTRSRYPGLTTLGLHGESLGAATSIAVMKYHPRVNFVVADCPFADIVNVLEGSMTYFHLPRFFVSLASAVTKIRLGFRFGQMKPIDSLTSSECDTTIPILFLHGEEDHFILPENSRSMHSIYAGYSEFHMIPGASHANSVLTDPELYQKYLYAFLDRL